MDIKVTSENILTQDLLKEIESLCTAEALPACEATCPLHVESKAILKYVTEKNYSKAFDLYKKRVPFPKLLAYICEEPCMEKCKRKDLGGKLNLQKIERFIVDKTNKDLIAPPFFPKLKGKALVIGGGLRGMTSALELAKKGFAVTIFEKTNKLGGKLNNLPEEQLPFDALNQSIDYLLDFPVTVNYNKNVKIENLDDAKFLLEKLEVDALYISFENPLSSQVENFTNQIENHFIFTGTRIKNKKDDFITKVYDGKTIALTIERAVTKVSILAGRESEIPFETKLFTSLNNMETVLPIETLLPFTEDEAILESKRCIQCECLECVKGCKFMIEQKSYPKKLAREVFNNLSIAMGIHSGNKMIGTCNLCGQCEVICPNGFSMEKIILAARNRMVEKEKMPPSYHDFAISDMRYSNGENFFLAKNQFGFETSKYVYFPSCQLGASEPDLLQKSYLDLTERLEGGVGLILGCCGVMSYWAGQDVLFKETINKLKYEIEKLGNPEIITACPTCKKTLEEHGGFKVKTIWEILHLDLESLPKSETQKTLAVHDSCGTRNDPETQNQIRDIVKHLGYNLIEPKLTKETSPCCGYGGLTAFVDSDLTDKISKFRINQMEGDSLTYCINCRDRFLKSNKKSFHFLELIYSKDTKTIGKSPTWSKRQENRKHLKNKMLKEIWKEDIMEKTPLNLIISSELEEIMDKRMILNSDIGEIITYAEKTKNYFIDKETNNIIGFKKIGNVTFWVVYQKEENNYIIKNTYSHRMTMLNK